MLTIKEKEIYQKVAREKGKSKYSFCDMHRQQISYYLRIDSLENAKEHFEKLAYLLNKIKETDRPEWYTMENLENDRKKIERLEKRKEWR